MLRADLSTFPLTVQLKSGERIECSSPKDIPWGVPFKVISSNMREATDHALDQRNAA